ncbi:DNA-binding protein [Corynebacterium aquilae DSM 44791]|uniref:DNA-binding protein n=1 Tax=Corynebacterium aquilae DSM 44791 TaxID=1431546 RepID=A0A1L7CGJ2_9CORY|nr:DNA-binding protein [Corynebacterium aquilae DSM 44791]
MRTCIARRRRYPASQLLRVVVDTESGQLVPDPRRRLPGRGCWIEPTVEAVKGALKRRAFERALKVSAPADAGRVRQYIEQLVDSQK